MYLGMIRAHRTANAGLGSLMPLVSPMVATLNRTGYAMDRLNVVTEYV